MPMALIVAAILKLTFCSESSTKSGNAKDSLRKKIRNVSIIYLDIFICSIESLHNK